MRGCRIVVPTMTLLLGACATEKAVPLDTSRHLSAPTASVEANRTAIPAPVTQALSLPPPKVQARAETYSVVVSNVKAQELLFALARDAKVNVDVHPGITGSVTLNALDQTLPQLLARISKQIDMRYELDGNTLSVMPDAPFLRNYRIDYVNMNRDSNSAVSAANQIATAGASGVQTNNAGTGNGAGGNGSTTQITTTARNRFWDTLIQNLKDLLRETDKVFPEGAAEKTIERTQEDQASIQSLSNKSNKPSDDITTRNADAARKITQLEKVVTFREAASIIANPEAGVVSIRATGRQHEKVQEFLSQVMSSARRQVLIEATIAEVELSQNYQQGVDWSTLNLLGSGIRLIQSAAGSITGPSATLMEAGFDSSGKNFTSSVKFLESFGNVRILSSPKLSVLNNQSAVLKVVDNVVYFTIQSNTNQNQNQTVTTFTTTVHSVPIGLVMSVTPQISEGNSVLLNVRPTLSRAIGEGAVDPNPALKLQGITNRIPVVRSREIESVLRINSGNIAIMGGLMEDLLNTSDDTVPGVSRIPGIGRLFENRNDTKRKTELVIFIKPTVLPDSGSSLAVDGLPREDFFTKPAAPVSAPY